MDNLGFFHVLAVVNRAAMNMRVHVSFSRNLLSGYMLKSGIAGSYGSFMYRFLRYLQTVLHVHEVDTFICAIYLIPDINDILWYLSFSF